MQTVVVTKNKHTHDCTTEEQLKRFLAAGWVKAKKQPPKAPDGEQEKQLEKEAEKPGE